MNRQYSSNTSLNLIDWDEPSSETAFPKSNSLVEMFDPIFARSINNSATAELNDSISSDDIFSPKPLQNEHHRQDLFTDLFEEEKSPRSSIYPNLNNFREHYADDDRHSVFNIDRVSKLRDNSEEGALRPSIFKEVIVDGPSHSLFIDEHSNGDMRGFIKAVGDIHNQSKDLSTDIRTHLLFDRILPYSYGICHSKSTQNYSSINNRIVTIIIRIDESCGGEGNEKFSGDYDVYTINEREIILEVIERYKITVNLSQLYLRISGRSEYLLPTEYPIKRYSYIFQCLRTHNNVKLVLEYVDIEMTKFSQASIMDEPVAFVYDSLEKEFNTVSRRSLSNSYTALTSYRNMVVDDLKQYNTRNMDLASITASIGVFKDKCRAICIVCDNLYSTSVAEAFVSIDCVLLTMVVAYEDNNHPNILKTVKQLIDELNNATNTVIELIHKVCVYCQMDFRISDELLSNTSLYSSLSGSQNSKKYRSPLSVKLLSICKPTLQMEQYATFVVNLQLRVGSQSLTQYLKHQYNNSSNNSQFDDSKTSIPASLKEVHHDFNSAICFNQKITFQRVNISQLPVDTSLYICVEGKHVIEGDMNTVVNEELCWAEIPLFDSRCFLRQGPMLIGMFQGARSGTRKEAESALYSWGYGINHHKHAIMMEIELPSFHVPIKYTFPPSNEDNASPPSEQFVANSDTERNEIVTQTWLHTKSEKMLPSSLVSNYLWNNRFHFVCNTQEFLAVCLAVARQPPTESSSSTNAVDYRDLLPKYLEVCRAGSESGDNCSIITQLLHVLGPRMMLRRVRQWAVQEITNLANSDDVMVFIPLFIEIMKYDVNLGSSGIEELLLELSVKNIAFATSLFWNLSSIDPKEIHGFKAALLLSSLQVIMNTAVKKMWNYQLRIVEHLEKTASIVKTFRGSVADRKTAMYSNLEELYDEIFEQNKDLESSITDVSLLNRDHILSSFRIPFHPGLQLTKLELKDCSYFNSFTIPLRIVFRGLDNENIDVMFKNGDDLRQDILILQLFQLMDDLWAGEGGLDLRTIHYKVMSTGAKSGFIELVSDCATLRKIQESHGGIAAPLTNNTVITDWLRCQNVTQMSYSRSVLNFLLTSVSSCVSTYLLGIGDRHNDNIMVQTSGRLFHIDFAKILGDAQTFAGIKRDRTPFVLTQDMVNVLNDFQISNIENGRNGSDPRTGMQLFIDLCCEAYNIIRRQWSCLISVLTIAASSNIPGVNNNTIQFVVKRLHLEMSDTKASEYFTDLIKKCINSISTPMNFVIHNLAQMKYGANNEGSLFSFTTKVYNNDPVITDISVSSVKKMRQPAKHYLYQIIVTRDPVRKSRISLQLSPGINTSYTSRTSMKSATPLSAKKFGLYDDESNSVTMTTIYRKFEHFMELSENLSKQFPLSVLPKWSNQIAQQGSPNSLTSAEARRSLLQQFVATILSQETEISQCDNVQTFFHSILSDEQTFEAEEQVFTHNSEYSPKRKKVPEIQLKITLKDKLEIFVKHARNLSFNRMSELPNSYVKTYLHPNPGYSTKRKTSIVSKSSTPSFNDILSYEKPELNNSRHLEVSIWHHETFGENICLGSLFIDIGELRSKNAVSPRAAARDQWFKLNMSANEFSEFDTRHSSDSYEC